MRKLILSVLTAVGLASAAHAQSPQFPQTLPANTVVGRLATGSGPAQAIPFATLTSNLLTNLPNNLIIQGSITNGSNCGNNAVGCLTVLQNLTAPDPTIPAQSFALIGTNLSNVGTRAGGSANQWGLGLVVTIPVTNSIAGYEKAALISECWTADPSTGGVNRDCVGVDARGGILPTNTTGRAWGGVDLAEIVPGGVGDGLLIGREIDIFNAGTDQAALNTVTTKIGLLIVAQGTANTTAGINLAASPALFHKGLVMDPTALVPLGTDANATFLELINRFKVQPNGVIISSVPLATSVAFFQSTATGISGISTGVLPATGTNADEFDWTVNFSTNTGTQYTGGGIDFNQVDATNAAPVTAMDIRLVTGARVSTHVLKASINNAGTAGAWSPITDNVFSLGDATHRYVRTFDYYTNDKPQNVNSLTTCNAGEEGSTAAVNNNNGTVFHAALVSGGTDHVQAYCDGSTWRVGG